MSWLDRMQPGLVLTSPQGDVFNALWVGDERTASKQLGIFNYPNINKPSVQDLGISGVEYPLTISFSGEDNDLVSTAFFEALSQTGKWVIDHPTKGRLFLQPVSFQESIQPIKSGDLTVFVTNWLDVVSDSAVLSSARISSLITVQNAVVDSAALDQMVDNVDLTTVENEQAVVSTVQQSLDAYNQTIKVLADSDSSVAARSASITRAIVSTISKSPIDLTVLGGQVQALISAPAAITGATLQTLKVYSDFIDLVLAAPVTQATKTNLNIVLIKELFLTSAVSSISLISGRSEPRTRAIAISNLEFVSLAFDTVTVGLDQMQELFITQFIKDQYFSQSDSFVDALTMVSQTISYLLSVSFDLSIEKRFLLKEQTPPIIVCVNEYGELGASDSVFDFFIESNNLKGDEILSLPVGFEVVVYV